MKKTTLFWLLFALVFFLSGCLQNNDEKLTDDGTTVEVTTGITAEEIIETPLPDDSISPSWQKIRYDDDRHTKNRSNDYDRYDDDDTTSQPVNPTLPTTTKTTTTTNTEVTFSLTDIKQHTTPTNCRTLVDGNVYDVSSFVSQHPGWAQRISQVCGIDATEIFARQHGSNIKAKAALANFQIGILVNNN